MGDVVGESIMFRWYLQRWRKARSLSRSISYGSPQAHIFSYNWLSTWAQVVAPFSSKTHLGLSSCVGMMECFRSSAAPLFEVDAWQSSPQSHGGRGEEKSRSSSIQKASSTQKSLLVTNGLRFGYPCSAEQLPRLGTSVISAGNSTQKAASFRDVAPNAQRAARESCRRSPSAPI